MTLAYWSRVGSRSHTFGSTCSFNPKIGSRPTCIRASIWAAKKSLLKGYVGRVFPTNYIWKELFLLPLFKGCCSLRVTCHAHDPNPNHGITKAGSALRMQLTPEPTCTFHSKIGSWLAYFRASVWATKISLLQGYLGRVFSRNSFWKELM